MKGQALRLATGPLIGWMRGTATTESDCRTNEDYATTQSALGANRLAQSHKGVKVAGSGAAVNERPVILPISDVVSWC